ncbi:hypothetical protein RQP46_002854 [Phenoliferia psychrophenolica]
MLTRGATSRLRSLATNLPYDVLRQIFLLEAADRCHWPCFWDVTGSPELLPFSLVCKSWTLPAQHVLFMSISLGVITDLEQFATVAKARPDLAAKVQALKELFIDQHASSWFLNVARAMPSTVTNFTFFTLCPELDPEPFFESVHTAIPDLKDLQSLSLHVYSDGQWEGFDYSDWEATLYGAFTDRGIDFTIHEDDFPELEWD